jgi:hypothetical protein
MITDILCPAQFDVLSICGTSFCVLHISMFSQYVARHSVSCIVRCALNMWHVILCPAQFDVLSIFGTSFCVLHSSMCSQYVSRHSVSCTVGCALNLWHVILCPAQLDVLSICCTSRCFKIYFLLNTSLKLDFSKLKMYTLLKNLVYFQCLKQSSYYVNVKTCIVIISQYSYIMSLGSLLNFKDSAVNLPCYK